MFVGRAGSECTKDACNGTRCPLGRILPLLHHGAVPIGPGVGDFKRVLLGGVIEEGGALVPCLWASQRGGVVAQL